MSRQLVLRCTRPAIYPRVLIDLICHPINPSRKLTTTPPPPSQRQSGTDKAPPSRPEGNNTLIILSALGALGGLYYYYTRGQPGIDRDYARTNEEEIRRKVREIGDGGKSTLENAASQVRQDYGQALKAKGQDATSAARARAVEAGTDLAERARQGTHEAHAKLSELKDTTERKIGDVRGLSEKEFDDEKEVVARQARKARGWFGWGSSK